ncbi:hypothetical protein KSS87_001228 [Heliosperma pusillum]|nr:hypothetical protein KSS87_001228 [Heliosperma pusillum]
MLELRVSSCFPSEIISVYVALAFVDATIAVLAFWQVFHLMIGLSNLGYVGYFVLTLIATCEGWSWWSSSYGFMVMAFPKILFFAAFLLLLSYWVDLCHQVDDDEDDESTSTTLLDKATSKAASSDIDSDQKCLPIPSINVGGRQRVVILVTTIVFVTMIASAVLIWIGMGKNPVDSSTVARVADSGGVREYKVGGKGHKYVYVDIFAIGILVLGGALACYGLLLYVKMSKVRSEGALSEMWKVTGLAVVSLVCFTTSALIALLSDIPVLYRWHHEQISGVRTSLLVILYYFIGFSVPSAFVLWVMRALPPSRLANRLEESRIVTFISDGSTSIHNRQHWTAVTSVQNQGSKASPI